MSPNGRGRAEFESASHPTGHGTNLGQAGDRSRDQPGEAIVASDPSTGLADKRQAFRPEQDAIKALTAIVFALRVPPQIWSSLMLPFRHRTGGARQIIQCQCSKLFCDAG